MRTNFHILRFQPFALLIGLLATAVFLTADIASAQFQAVSDLTGEVVSPDDSEALLSTGQPPGASVNPASSGTPTEKTRQQKLVELLLKTKFDRTAASVLNAWSAPAKEKDESAEEKKTDVQAAIAGTVLNLFEDFAVFEISSEAKPVAGKDFVVRKGDETIGVVKVLSLEEKRCSAKFVVAPKEGLLAKDDKINLDPQPSAAPPKKESDDAIVKQQVEQFQRDVTLGNWAAVKEFLAALNVEDGKPAKPESVDAATPDANAAKDEQPAIVEEQKTAAEAVAQTTAAKKDSDDKEKVSDAGKVYQHLLTSLSTAYFPSPDSATEAEIRQLQAQARSNHQIPPPVYLTPADILALADAAPAKLTDANVSKIASMIRKSAAFGHDFNEFVETIKAGTPNFGGEELEKRLAAASLFMQTGMTERVEQFLPALDDEQTDSNIKALKLWSQLAITSYHSEQKVDWLVKAWKANQTILAGDSEKGFEQPEKQKAMENLIELSPLVDKELGQQWLNASFTDSPDRGMLILSNLGRRSADMASKAALQSADERLKLLRIQNKAVESLVSVAPKTAEKWKQACTLLAQNWLVEANISKQYSRQTSRNSFMQIDMYGNYFWSDGSRQQMYNSSNRQPRPIGIGDMLEIRPGEQWLALIDKSLQTQLNRMFAELHLRINEEDKAFPHIEQIAADHPKISRELIHEFLRIWTRNHDPNSDKRRRNPYIYFYGFDQKADAIPLTRSKQQRNLKELSGWVARIRQLPIEDIDEGLLSNAFTTCHSSAEVFDLERVRTVFGDLQSLKPETVAAICEKMRANLATNWRSVKEQETKQTKRREPEVQQEVLRGYRVARELADESLKGSPDNWQLHLTIACLMHDENDYSQSIQKSSEFSDRRDAAFAMFKTAADKYAAIVSTLDMSKQSTEVYDSWFYAALGAVDLGRVTDKTVADEKQFPMIRAAIGNLPGSMAEVHLAKFANNLFTRMSPIKPEMKFRYLNAGFVIVEDHPRAWEARNLFDYYKDLTHEISLDVQIDGTDVVGRQAFGVYISLLHTKEIEREAGGFGKYVQNQNSMAYAYNYGRPRADYRDKFQDSINQALEEHFEVINVTFESPKTMHSRVADRAGLRVTPYAYALLKARGPEVDRIASLKIDLDFLDTSGYVVIPIESPAVVIDASSEADPRPVEELKITQTLDERQAEGGKLVLDITASARGLVPELDQIMSIDKEDFEVVNIDDQGNLPTSFDEESEEIQILSDRSWTVEYRAKSQEAEISRFAFSDAKMEVAENKLQRYEDADLVAAEPIVELKQTFESGFSWRFLYWLIPLASLVLTGIGFGIYSATREKRLDQKQFHMPGDVNPFTVLTLLKEIRERNGISESQAADLQTSISRIESFYFAEDRNGDEPDDLKELARTWVNRAN